jgi:hypothetical protein
MSGGKYKLSVGRVENLKYTDFPAASRQKIPFDQPVDSHIPANVPGMSEAMNYSQAAGSNYIKAMSAAANADDRAKATEGFVEAVTQQTQIAARHAMDNGEDAQRITKVLTPLIQKDLAGNSKEVLRLRIAQTFDRQAAGTTLGQLARDNTAAGQSAVQATKDAAQAQTLAQDLAPGGGYAAQAGRKEANSSAQAAAQKTHDQALADARQVQDQVNQIDLWRKGIALDQQAGQLQKAQPAYDTAKGALATTSGRLGYAGVATNTAMMTDFSLPSAYFTATGNEPWKPLTVQAGAAGLEAAGMSPESAEIAAN